MPLDGLYLHIGRSTAIAVVGEQVGRDLVLDEQLLEGLRQLDLLGQSAGGQVEQPLQLRLDLHHSDGKHSALELHCPVGLGERPLLRRQRLDRVLELLGRRHRLERQRDPKVVLVLDYDRVHGLERGRRVKLAEHENERRELPCPRRQHESAVPGSLEALREVGVQEPVALDFDRALGVEPHAHVSVGVDLADERRNRLGCHPLLPHSEAARRGGLYRDCPFRESPGQPDRIAELPGPEVLAVKLALVLLHELGEALRTDVASDGRDKLRSQQVLDVAHCPAKREHEAAEMLEDGSNHDAVGRLEAVLWPLGMDCGLFRGDGASVFPKE